MNPEKRLFVIHKYTVVELTILFVAAFVWMFGPKRSGIADAYRTFYNFCHIFFRLNFYGFLSTVLIFFFFCLGRLYNMFHNRIFFCHILFRYRIIFCLGSRIREKDFHRHKRTVLIQYFPGTVQIAEFNTVLI